MLYHLTTLPVLTVVNMHEITIMLIPASTHQTLLKPCVSDVPVSAELSFQTDCPLPHSLPKWRRMGSRISTNHDK